MSIVAPSQRFTIDNEVTCWANKMKRRKGTRSSIQNLTLSLFLPVLVGVAVMSLISVSSATQNPSGESVINAGYSIIAFALIGVMTLALDKAAETTTAKNNKEEAKLARRHLKRSVRTARKLGDVFPVLTKSHIDTSFRFEKRITAYTLTWKPSELDTARALLFQDMDREEIIYSIIEDRGMRTAAEVFEALAGMEANGKALQEGWL